MEQRKLGHLTVPAMGLGCMGMSRLLRQRPTRARRSRPSTARSSSACTFLDTAEMYGPYTNEELVGRAIAGRRDEVSIATKFGIRSRRRPRTRRPRDRRLARERAPLDRGLAAAARHRPRRPLLPAPRRPQHADRGDRRRARPSWSRQGKIRHIGLSEAAPETIRRAHAVHPITARADRVLAVDARPRGRGPARPAASSASASSPTRRSAAASSRAASRRPTSSTRATSAATARASPARRSRPTW